MSKGRLEEIVAVVESQKESVRKLSHNDLNWLIEKAERVQELEEIEQEYVDLNNDFTNLALERNRYREVITELRDFVKRGENECNIKQLIMKKTNGLSEGD